MLWAYRIRALQSGRRHLSFYGLIVFGVLPSLLTGCTNGSPLLRSLGIFGNRLEPLEVKIPAADKIQVARLEQSFKFEGQCSGSLDGFEYSSDGEKFVRLTDAEVETSLTCAINGKFKIILKELLAVSQKTGSLGKITTKNKPVATVLKSELNSVTHLYFRGYSATGTTDSVHFQFSTAPASEPVMSGVGLTVQSNRESNLGLLNGFINPAFGVQVVWTSSWTDASDVFLEVSSDGGGTWIPIVRTENSGAFTLSSEMAQAYLVSGSVVRVAASPGGTKVLALSPFVVVRETSPAEPTALSLLSPGALLNFATSLSVGVASSAEFNHTIGLYSDSVCSKIVGSKKSAGVGTDSLDISGLTVDGAYSYYAQVIDGAGNRSPCFTSGLTYTLDQTKPMVTGLTDDLMPTVTKDWNWSCEDANGPCTYRWVILSTITENPFAGDPPFLSATSTSKSGDGLFYLYVQAKDSAGNLSNPITRVSTQLDSTAPGLSFSAPSKNPVRAASNFYFDLTYSYIKPGSISLKSSDITYQYSGLAAGCSVASIEELSATQRRIHLTGCAGESGSVKIRIASGTAQSPAGVLAPASGFSNPVDIDNLGPSISLQAPSKTDANSSVTFTFNVSVLEASTIHLTPSQLELFGTAVTDCVASVINGTTSTPTISVTGCSGNGTVQVRVRAGVATDIAENPSAVSADSQSVNIDNVAPVASFGSPDFAFGNQVRHFSFPVTFSGAATVYDVTPAKVSFSGTATAGCAKSVTGGTTANPIIEVWGCSGNGTLRVHLASGAAKDAATNPTDSVQTLGTVEIDNIAPSIAVGSPSQVFGNFSSSIDYGVSYLGVSAVNLISTQVVFGGTAATGCSAQILNGTTLNPTVRVTGCSGNGSMNFKITSGSAYDAAGNTHLDSSTTTNVTIDNLKPAIVLGTPSVLAINNLGEVDISITYTGASAISLTDSKILLNGVTAGCIASVFNGTTSNPTVHINGCTGNGNLNFTIQAGSATDEAGNQALESLASSTLIVDNILPTVTGLSDNATPVAVANWNWSCSDVSNPCLYRSVVSASPLGTPFSVSDAFISTATATQSGGNGTYYLYVQAKDGAGNMSSITSVTAQLNSDKPGITIGAPSKAKARSIDNFYWDVSYVNASSISLATGNVSFNYSGSVSNCAVQGISTPETGIRRVEVGGCLGDGTVSISLAAGTATSPASLAADPAGPSSTVLIDNTKPTLTLSAPDKTLIRGTDTVTVVVSYSADSIVNLQVSHVLLSGTGAVGCGTPIVSNGTTLNPTVQVSGCGGNGNLRIQIAANSSTDDVLNTSNASALSSPVIGVDNNPPNQSIGGASTSLTNSSGVISFPVTYTGASTINLTSAHVNPEYTGTATCTFDVQNGSTVTPTVRFYTCLGNGTVKFSITAGAASDPAGNATPISLSSGIVTIDNEAPIVVIGSPSYSATNEIRAVSYSVTYTGGIFYTLDTAKIGLSGATAGCIVGVSNGTTSSAMVTISGCSGNGALNFSVAAGATTDSAGNSSLVTGPSSTVMIDNIKPTVTVSEPSVVLANVNTTIDFDITFGDADSIVFNSSFVSLTGASSGCVIAVSTTGATTRRVSLSGCNSNNGSVQIKIAANAASDFASNATIATAWSTGVEIDNSPPEIIIGAPSFLNAKASTQIVYNLNVTGASMFALLAPQIVFSGAGSVNCSAVISGVTLVAATVTVSGCTGEGAMTFKVAAGAAADSVGNSSALTSLSATVTIDNTAPTVLVGAGSPSIGDSTTPFQFAVSTGDASSSSLSHFQVELLGATAGCAVAIVNPSSLAPTIQVSGCTGDGTLSARVLAGVAFDSTGNQNNISLWSAGSVTLVNSGMALTYAPGITRLDLQNATALSYFNSSIQSFLANLNDGIDLDGFVGYGAIDHYEVAVGTATGTTNISNWMNVGLDTTPPLPMASYKAGHQYFTSVRAVDANNVSSTVLSDAAGLFYQMTAVAPHLEASANQLGSVIVLSEDGLRMAVGDPIGQKVYIYKRNEGVQQSWTHIATLDAATDSILSASNNSEFGAAVAIEKMATGNYFYIIGAPAAKSNTGGGIKYGGRVVTHFESGGTVSAKLQTIRALDIRNHTASEGLNLDRFGESLSIWNDGVNLYLLVSAPGQDCLLTAPVACSGSLMTDAGAIYSVQISCPSGICDASSLDTTMSAKYIEDTPGAGRAYGKVIKTLSVGIDSRILITAGDATSGTIYLQKEIENSLPTKEVIPIDAMISNSQKVAIVESDASSLGRPLIAYLDSTGTVQLKKFDGTAWLAKSGASSGWTSVALSSDASINGLNDRQGISFVLGKSSPTPQAVMGLVDWTLGSGMKVFQDLTPPGLSGTDMFGQGMVAHDGYISISAPGLNTIYSFH